MEESLKANTKMAKPNGHGKMTYPDGRVFEGEYKDGKPNGRGKRPILMEESLKANTKMASRMATER